MAKRILIITLALATVLELVMSLAGLFLPSTVMEMFHLASTPDTMFLGAVVAWMLLVATLCCGLALKWVLDGKEAGWTLSLVLGIWWIGIGLDLALRWGQLTNLFLDGAKGAIIAASAWASRPGRTS